MKSKKELKYQQRKEIKERLINLTDKQQKSEIIFKKLLTIQKFINAKSVFCYLSTEQEVDTKDIISYCFENNKQLSVPYIEGKEMYPITYNQGEKLVKNQYAIYEPEYSENKLTKEIDVAIIPLVGFDGIKRLGHGGGYYDKFMNNNPNSFNIGLAFEEQKIEGLIVEDHDIPLDMVITNKEIYTK